MSLPYSLHEENLCLFTDLYELTMMQSYLEHGMNGEAVFDFFVRKLPPQWNYLIACGLSDALEFLEGVRFTPRALDYLKDLKVFSSSFLDYLRGFRFTGEVYALPEGTPVFPNEPILEVRAPLIEAQWVETFLINQLNFQTLTASKASRVVSAAQGRKVVDFGVRRMQGLESAVRAVRAFYIAGIDSTSNVLAGQRYQLPVSGTMAHSYIQAHDREAEAFEDFLESFPEATLLVDTYDTLEGIRKVIELDKKSDVPLKMKGVRLDSGDLLNLSKKARKLLDENGLTHLSLFASGGLDEYTIDDLVKKNAPLDGFGVGTKMGVVSDHPYLDCAYKLVEYAGRPRIKLSTEKVILPGRKQIYRVQKNNQMHHDEIALEGESHPGRPLLVQVMTGGTIRREAQLPLEEIRSYAAREIQSLPQPLQKIQQANHPYPVGLSPQLKKLQKSLERKFQKTYSS